MTRRTLGMLIVSILAGVLPVASSAQAERRPTIAVTPAADVKYQPLDPNDKEGKGPQIAIMFGDMKKRAPVGFLFKVPAGFRPGPHIHTADYYSAVIQGTVHDFAPGGDEGQPIGPGGHWFQAGRVAHDNHCASSVPCVIFIYSPDGYDYLPVNAITPRAETRSSRAERRPFPDKAR